MNRFTAGQKVIINSDFFKNEDGIIIHSRNDGTVMVNLIHQKVHILFWEHEISEVEED